jgi:hypothetical protein
MVIVFGNFNTLCTADGIQFPAFNAAARALEALLPEHKGAILSAYAAGCFSYTIG